MFLVHMAYKPYPVFVHMTGYAGSRDYVRNLQFPWRTPHRSTHPTEKQESDPLVADSDPPPVADSDPLIVSSVHCGVLQARRLQVPYVIRDPADPAYPVIYTRYTYH